jgi:hypothetical protein
MATLQTQDCFFDKPALYERAMDELVVQPNGAAVILGEPWRLKDLQ